MSTRGQWSGMIGRVVVGCILLALPYAGGRAEVGVALNDAGGVTRASGPYILGSIVDDPDPVPVGIAWRRITSNAPGRIVLNEGGEANGDGRPAALFASAADAPIVAWARSVEGGFDVVLSRFEGGAWTEPQTLAGSPVDELDPHLVEDPADGSVHLLYWVFDAAPHVVHRQAPPDLSSWSAPVIVSLPGEVASRPAAVFHDGVLHVVYESHGAAYGSLPRHIVLAHATGTGFEHDLVTGSYHGEPNWPEAHSAAGKLWLDWVDGGTHMTWTLRAPNGQWGPFSNEPFSGNGELHYHVRGAIKEQALD